MIASDLVPRCTAATFLKAPIVSDGEQAISVLAPSRLLMKTRMSCAEAVVLEEEMAFFLLWVDGFFSMREPRMAEARCTDL